MRVLIQGGLLGVCLCWQQYRGWPAGGLFVFGGRSRRGWLVDWLIGGASPRCVRVGLSVSFGELCATWWCALLVGKLLVLDLLLAGGWSRIMSRWWLLVVGWPARGLYALGGRSRSGKAADSFRQNEDFFCYMMI